MAAKFCSSCGAALAPGAAFCGACGARPQAAENPPDAASPPAASAAPPEPPAAVPPPAPAAVAPPPLALAPSPPPAAGANPGKIILIGVMGLLAVAAIVLAVVFLQENGGSKSSSASTAPPVDISVNPSGTTSTSQTGPAQVNATPSAYLVGRWTRRGDCSRALEFRQDGTFVTADGTPGFWTASGALGTYPIQMTAGGRTERATVRAFNHNQFYLYPADGSPSMILSRCP